MSRTASKPHFYEIGQAQDSPGKWSRRHILRCGKCDASIGFKALTDEKIRKRAINLGWDVGKTQTQHLCPKHAHAQKSYAQPQPPPPRVTLQEAWEQASTSERVEFWTARRRDFEPAARLHADVVSSEWQHGPHIDNMPIEPSQPINKHPPAVQLAKPEERTEPDPEDIEVADIIFGKRKSA
jgi:hypothetical protein